MVSIYCGPYHKAIEDPSIWPTSDQSLVIHRVYLPDKDLSYFVNIRPCRPIPSAGYFIASSCLLFSYLLNVPHKRHATVRWKKNKKNPQTCLPTWWESLAPHFLNGNRKKLCVRSAFITSYRYSFLQVCRRLSTLGWLLKVGYMPKRTRTWQNIYYCNIFPG